MKKLIALILCALMLCAFVPFSVSAADGMTVAYVMDGGSGDGTSADKAFGNLQDAYNALDLSKDCTIVICGPYTQLAHFDPWIEYEGNLTITSVYGGVDYRATANAEYIVNAAYRFFLYGDTKFDDINVRLKGNFFFFICQANELYIGEGFEAAFDAGTDGSSFAKGLSVLAGFQNGAGLNDTNLETDKGTNVTILSAKYWVISAYNRQSVGNITGKANITLGGDADVNFMYFTSVNKPAVKNGDVEITVKDNANVHYLLASPDDNKGLDPISVNSLTVNWLGGNIESASLTDAMCCPNFTAANTAVITNGSTLNYSDAVKTSASFELVSSLFDTSKAAEAPTTDAPTTEAPATEAPATEAPATEAPATEAPATDAPVVTTEAPAQPEDTPATGDASVMVVFAAAAVLCVAAVVVIKKRER